MEKAPVLLIIIFTLHNSFTRIPAFLREISEGTSYQIVR